MGIESVHIGGFVVSPCLLDHGVSTVKDLFLARHHAKEFVVHVVNIVISRHKNYRYFDVQE